MTRIYSLTTRIILAALCAIFATIMSFCVTGDQLWHGKERGFPYHYTENFSSYNGQKWHALRPQRFCLDVGVYFSIALGFLYIRALYIKRARRTSIDKKPEGTQALYEYLRAFALAALWSCALPVLSLLYGGSPRRGFPYPFFLHSAYSLGDFYSVNVDRFWANVGVYFVAIWLTLSVGIWMHRQARRID